MNACIRMLYAFFDQLLTHCRRTKAADAKDLRDDAGGTRAEVAHRNSLARKHVCCGSSAGGVHPIFSNVAFCHAPKRQNMKKDCVFDPTIHRSSKRMSVWQRRRLSQEVDSHSIQQLWASRHIGLPSSAV